MDRRTGNVLALTVGVLAAAAAFQVLHTTPALALALGALARLAIAFPDLLVYGHQPWPVARWAGAAAGVTVAAAMLVYSGGAPALGSGERYAVALLVLGSLWAGVGFGVGMARADAAAERA